MTEQPEALRLADSAHLGYRVGWQREAAAELRRLHEEVLEQCRVNAMGAERELKLLAEKQELLEALKLALFAHGKMLLSDPPQEAWKTYRVEEKARAAIAKHRGAA